MIAAATSGKAVTIRRRSAWPVYAIALAIFVGLSIATPDFLTVDNVTNLLTQQSASVATVIGETFVILTGGLDISVGSVMSMTTAILSLGLNPALATVIVIAAAGAVGFANGYGVTRLGVHPILMTLSSLTVVQGISLLLCPTPGGTAPDYVNWLANAMVGPVPLPILVTAATIAVAVVVLRCTRFGLHVMAVGGSAQNARLGGVRSDRVILFCYVISSLCAALGGIHLTGRIGSGDPLVGQPFAIDAVAATALGGTLLSGGLGSIGGSVVGVGVLALLGNGLNLLNVSSFYQLLIKGVLLVAAVSAHRRREPGL